MNSYDWNSEGMEGFLDLKRSGFQQGTDKSVFLENAYFMDFISSQIKHELMTLLITKEARYDKDQSIRHVFVSICGRKPTKCRAVHRAPEAIMLQNILFFLS